MKSSTPTKTAARHQELLEERLCWNQITLDKAKRVTDNCIQDFYPSLFLNMGQSYELLGNFDEAIRYCALAAELGVIHPIDNSKPLGGFYWWFNTKERDNSLD